MKVRSLNYWFASAFLCGLTSVALAEVAGTPPGAPVSGNSSPSQQNIDRSTHRPQPHPHGRKAKQLSSAKPSTKQSEQNAGATQGQPQVVYGSTNFPFSLIPDVGGSHDVAGTAQSDVLARNSAQYGSPATSGSKSSTTAPDGNWRFMASPLMNATHAHEIGATVSVRHDF
jgi:hypothetical protein